MQQLDRKIPACAHILDRRGCLGTLSPLLPTCGCRPQGQAEALGALGSGTGSAELESSSVEGWWPACPFSPLGGRAGSHLPDSAVCTATGAAKEGIFPAGAAQGNVSISRQSLSPQDTAAGKLAWAKECVSKSLFLARGNQ